jgi:hypothetical protein
VSDKRKALIEKIEKAYTIAKDENTVSVCLTLSELILIKLGVKTLDLFQTLIEDEMFNN